MGANDGAAGTAVVPQLARTLRRPRHTIQFVFFDGEETPRGAPDSEFERTGCAAARSPRPLPRARAMVLLDFVGDRRLRIPREGNSDGRASGAAARRREASGRGRRLPRRDPGGVLDDHMPFLRQGVPSIDLIDFDFPCCHRPLRRPVGGLRAERGRGGRDDVRVAPTDSEARSLASSAMAATPEKLLLAAPRGYCAGVDRAVQTVERALELYGPPVYVRKEIVHNKHVVEQLRERGAIFVEEETEVPEGETVVFSAHGVSPAVHANAETRRLKTIDATCPLVTKVHVEAKKFAAEGYTIVLMGHEGHEEVEGTMGEAPGALRARRDRGGRGPARVDDPDRVAYLTQTTLSVDETDRIIRRLRERFPNITGPKSDDICYATTNRQLAVRQMARECDLVLVIGSRNSSNSNRLVEVARDHGADSHLIDNERPGARRSGSRASAWWGSPPARARPRSWCSAWWPSSGSAAPRTSRSSRSSRRTCASCCPRRSARAGGPCLLSRAALA